jgi:hypothetical protein
MLNKAKSDIGEAMRLLLVSSVQIQVSTRHLMEGVGARLEKLHEQINSNESTKHEAADLVRMEVRKHQNKEGVAGVVAHAVSEILVKMGVVSCELDFVEQFDDLQREAESLRTAKVMYDKKLLAAIKSLSTPPPPEPPLASKASAAIRDCLVCPISNDVMRDPVKVLESCLTYDRKSLCASLLLYPDLEPGTGQKFDRPLHYAPNIALRNLMQIRHGDGYY